MSEPTAYARRVVALVDRIPPGAVLTYGDVAELMGEGSARGVGAVMARWGAETCWWRVIRADGIPALIGDGRAVAHLRRERTPWVGVGDKVDLARARWNGR